MLDIYRVCWWLKCVPRMQDLILFKYVIQKLNKYMISNIDDFLNEFNWAEDSLTRESGTKVHHANIQASKVRLVSMCFSLSHLLKAMLFEISLMYQ